MNQPSRPVAEIKKDVLLGDTAAYWELSTAYLDYPPQDFLFWALLMANKYDYSVAYLDVFYSLKDSFNPEANNYTFGDMDKKTKAIAIEYLKKAVEREVDGASEVWKSVHQSYPNDTTIK